MYRTYSLGLLALCATALPSAAQQATFQPPLPPTRVFEDFDNFRGNWVNLELNTQDVMSLDPFVSAYLVVPNIPECELKLIYAPTMITVGTVPLPPMTTALMPLPGGFQFVGLETGRGTLFQIDLVQANTIQSVDIGGRATGMIVHPSGDRVFISCAESDEVVVVETANWTVAQRISTRIPDPNPANPDILNSPSPVAMSFDAANNRLYVLSQFSGNNTTAIGPTRNGATPVANSLDVDCVVDVAAMAITDPTITPFPDDDVIVLQTGASPGSASIITAQTQKGVGALNFDVGVEPNSGDVWVLSQSARNAQISGGANFIGGDVVANQITVIDPMLPPGVGRTVINVDLIAQQNGLSFAQLTDVAFSASQGRAYIASYGGDKVIVFDTQSSTPNYIGCYDVQASDPSSTRTGTRRVMIDGDLLFVYNKADNSVAQIDTSVTSPVVGGTSVPSVQLGYDPTPAAVKAGRGHMINAEHSLNGAASCASCHFDGGLDELTWDLSSWWDPVPTTHANLTFEKDRKGPMVTQSLRGLAGAGRLHWRGERAVFTDFNEGAFVDLLKRPTAIPAADMLDFQTYVHSLPYLPNPRQPLDRDYSFTPNPGVAANGKIIFTSIPTDGGTCATCHTMPLGTNAEPQRVNVGALAPTTKVTQLRGLQDKLTNATHVAGGPIGERSAVGSGLVHNGAIHDIHNFVDPTNFAVTTTQQDDLVSFLQEFDTGLAPSTGFVKTITANNLVELAPTLLFATLEAQAGRASFAIYSALPGTTPGTFVPLEMFLNPANAAMTFPNSAVPPVSTNLLGPLIAGGTPVTFVGFPGGMAWRASVDNDNDGILNFDEFNFGSNPSVYDTDGDGFSDGHEMANGLFPNVIETASPDNAAPFVVGGTGGVVKVFGTSESLKLEFATNEPCIVGSSFGGVLIPQAVPAGRGLTEFQTNHQIVLVGLPPATAGAIDIVMLDNAGNVGTLVGVNVNTELRVAPLVARVQSMTAGAYTPPNGSNGPGGSIDISVTITDQNGNNTIVAPFEVDVFAHYEDPTTPQTVVTTLMQADTNTAGVATFTLQLPVSAATSGVGSRILRAGVRDGRHTTALDPVTGLPIVPPGLRRVYSEANDVYTVVPSGLDVESAKVFTF